MAPDTPVRFLSRADVIAAGGGRIDAAIDDIRTTMVEWRAGQAEMPPENSVRLGPPDAIQARAYALPARIGRVAGVKWTAHCPPSGTSHTLITDALSGALLGIVESGLLTVMRTAAVSALVLQLAAPGPLRRVAVLGAGAQARAHLRMLVELFPALAHVALWNRSPQRAAALAAEVAERAPWPIESCIALAGALEGADAVLTCTNAATPLLGAEAMQPGRMLLQIGYNEVSFDAIDRADAVVVDLWGDFCRTSAKSLFQMHRAGRFPPDRVSADLAALVLDGWHPAPRSAVYFSSFGLNIFDIAIAARVLHTATAGGVEGRR